MADTARIDLESELLAALLVFHECRHASYAYEHLQAADFLLPEHAALFEELQQLPKAKITAAVLKTWLAQDGGPIERLRRAGGWSDYKSVVDWLISTQADERNIPLPQSIPWYCHRLRARRIKDGAAALARAHEDNCKPPEWYVRQLERLNAIPRLESPPAGEPRG